MKTLPLAAALAFALVAGAGCAKSPAPTANPQAAAMAAAKAAAARGVPVQLKREIEEALEDTDGETEIEVIWLKASWDEDEPGTINFSAEADKTADGHMTPIIITGTFDAKAHKITQSEEHEDTRRARR